MTVVFAVAGAVALAIVVVLRRLATRPSRRQESHTRAPEPGELRPLDPPPARAIGGPSVWLVVGRRAKTRAFSAGRLAKAIQIGATQVVLAEVFAGPEQVDELDAVVESLGVRVIHHAFGADPAAVVRDAIATAKRDSADLVIIDATRTSQGRRTAGPASLQELQAVAAQEAEVTEVLLVLEGRARLEDAPPLVEGIAVTGAIFVNPSGRDHDDFVVDHLTLRLLRFPRREPTGWTEAPPPETPEPGASAGTAAP